MTKRWISVTADRATASTPFLKTVTVEDMLAKNSEETSGIVHSFETNRTCRELD